MSKKILIDEDILWDVMNDCIYARDNAKVTRIMDAIKQSKQTHFSVLEWYPMSEAPSSNAERVIVEYSDGGFGFVFGHPEIIKDDPDYKRWSYLPE